MSQKIEKSELVGEYKHLLANDSETGKRLFHVFEITDEGGSSSTFYRVEQNGNCFRFGGLGEAVSNYNKR